MNETTHMQGADAVAKIRQRIKFLAWTFFNNLEGRYQKWISDEMLISLLANGTLAAYGMRGFKHIAASSYDVGSNLFENCLEHDCAAGGNGHHVAQRYSEMFKDFDK